MVKNTTKLLLMIGVIWLWLPTGPSDVFIIPFLIETLGMELYIIISIGLVWWLYKNIEGKTIEQKLKVVHREAKRLIKKIL